jgi:hypothetical protein
MPKGKLSLKEASSKRRKYQPLNEMVAVHLHDGRVTFVDRLTATRALQGHVATRCGTGPAAGIKPVKPPEPEDFSGTTASRTMTGAGLYAAVLSKNAAALFFLNQWRTIAAPIIRMASPLPDRPWQPYSLTPGK